MSLETYKKYIKDYLISKKYTKRHGKILFRKRYDNRIHSCWVDRILFDDGFVLYVTMDGHRGTIGGIRGHFFPFVVKAKKYSKKTTAKILKDKSFKVLDEMAIPDMYW